MSNKTNYKIDKQKLAQNQHSPEIVVVCPQFQKKIYPSFSLQGLLLYPTNRSEHPVCIPLVSELDMLIKICERF